MAKSGIFYQEARVYVYKYFYINCLESQKNFIET